METLSVIHGHNGPLGHYTPTMGDHYAPYRPTVVSSIKKKVNYDSPCAAPLPPVQHQ